MSSMIEAAREQIDALLKKAYAAAAEKGILPAGGELNGKIEIPKDTKNGDYAWFLHVIKSLEPNGKAGIVMPHGILFRGNAEETIRKAVLATHYIKGIVSLPANLFYGTGIPACLVFIDKENAETREGIFFIDASNGFKKDGNKNRLREQDIEKIVRVYTAQEEIKGYSRLVPYTEILEANDGRLLITDYRMEPFGYAMIEKELEKIPREKTKEIARQNIADIRSSNRRDFRF